MPPVRTCGVGLWAVRAAQLHVVTAVSVGTFRGQHDALLAAGRHLFAECSGAVSAEQLGDDQVSGVRPPAGSVSRGGPHPLAVINESERARQPAG